MSFDTPLGAFHFTRLPPFNYAGVERVVDGRAIFLMASPLKALVDCVDVYKSDLHPSELFASLRVDLHLVARCRFPAQVSARTVAAGRRAIRFIDSLNRLLKKGL